MSILHKVQNTSLYKQWLGFFFSYQQIESLNKPLILLSVILRLKSALNSNLYGYKKTNNGSNQVNKWQILPPYSEDILNINIHFLKLTWKLEGTYNLKDLSSYYLGEYSISVFHQKYVFWYCTNSEQNETYVFALEYRAVMD